MNRQHQLTYCKKCKHREFDFNRGILCGLTHQEADFEAECPDFIIDDRTKSLENYRNAQSQEYRNETREKKEQRRRGREQRKKERWERRVRLRRYPDKIRKSDIGLLAGIGMITLALSRIIGYSEYTFSTTRSETVSVFLLFISSATAALLLRKKEHWRFRFFGDMKFKLLYATTLTFLFMVYYVVFQVNLFYFNWASFVALFLFILVMTMLSMILVIPLNLLFRKISGYDDKAK